MHRSADRLSLLVVLIPLLAGIAASLFQGWHLVFDDAFISYRYAHNLAAGHGLTWNPGSAPTEGYTNFLLVVGLVPAIAAGFDPLTVTRVASLAAALVMSGLLFATARRWYGLSPVIAALAASIVLLVPATRQLSLSGLETVLYTTALLASLLTGIALVRDGGRARSGLLGALTFVTFLLRPEAVLLLPVIAAVALWVHGRSSAERLVPAALVFGACSLAYFAWKLHHFGALLPNPFFVKAAGSLLFNRAGARSVMGFVTTYGLLAAFALASLRWLQAGGRLQRHGVTTAAGGGLLLLYAAFFTRTETLMDLEGRFMYPMVPVLVLLAMPALGAAAAALESARHGWMRWVPLTGLCLMLAFDAVDLVRLYDNLKVVAAGQPASPKPGLMQRELEVAQALARFPGIANVRIACADAGVMPYYSGAIWLDVAGLNDTFLAREKDIRAAADYFFAWSPDLVLHPGSADRYWLRHGHGPLGDYAAWSADGRWRDFTYVGTVRTGGSYDLQVLVRTSSPLRAALEPFLRAHVVDGWYASLPLPLGEKPGGAPAETAWTASPAR
jgi:arabinofuranosyltransferase